MLISMLPHFGVRQRKQTLRVYMALSATISPLISAKRIRSLSLSGIHSCGSLMAVRSLVFVIVQTLWFLLFHRLKCLSSVFQKIFQLFQELIISTNFGSISLSCFLENLNEKVIDFCGDFFSLNVTSLPEFSEG